MVEKELREGGRKEGITSNDMVMYTLLQSVCMYTEVTVYTIMLTAILINRAMFIAALRTENFAPV